MSTTFTLPNDGGTAIIRDPKSVPEGKRRPVTRLQMRLAASPVAAILERKVEVGDDKEAIKAIDAELVKMLGNDTELIVLLDDLNDALIDALVESFDGQPVAAATDLPGHAYDALKAETAKYVTDLMPTFSATPDPTSPTPPSVT